MNTQIIKWSRVVLILVAVFGSFLMTPVAMALTTISLSYASASYIPVGSLVSLVKNSTDTVEAALSSNVDNLLGVVVNPNNSLLSLTSDSNNQTEVTTSGLLDVLVSNVNGEIAQGDHITASPIAGVGMKADANVRVIGIAQGAMTSKYTQTIKGANGKDEQVTLGEIPVLINVAYFFKQPDKSIIPAALQSLANSLAGRDVQPIPIIISGAIFIVTLIAVMSVIYSMIRSSIISVGRNPMSQSAVYRDVIQLSALVLTILAVATVAIYLVLTRM